MKRIYLFLNVLLCLFPIVTRGRAIFGTVAGVVTDPQHTPLPGMIVQNTFTAGLQLLHNRLHRQQLGKGTADSDFDLSLTDAGRGRNLWFNTRNLALFVENVIRLTPAFSLLPGLRYE